MKTISLLVFMVLGLCALGVLTRPSVAATPLSIAFTDHGTAVGAAEITLFLSSGTVSAVTDASGVARFNLSSGKGFWIEVNGRRLAKFYLVADAPRSIDLAQVGTIRWQGRR